MIDERSAPQWWGDVEADAIHARAAQWFVRLQDPQVSLEDTVAWQQWIAEDARHKQAFARIENTYRDMGEMPRPALSSTLAGANHANVGRADRYDGSTSVSEWLQRAPVGIRQGRLAARVVGIAAATAGVAVALVWFVSGGPQDRGSANWLRTSVGENRTASLPDGSKVTLGGATELQVSFDAHARQVELTRGEAFFVVAKDAARPFSVRAGDSEVTAVGTQFNVRRRNDRVSVAVVEGRVRVQAAAPAIPFGWLREFKHESKPVQLDAGQQTFIGDTGVGPATSLTNPSAVTGWRTGQLAFDREPLRDVLEDVNRYASRRIVVNDDATGSLEITGTVSREDIDGWVRSLERAFRLEAVEDGGRIVIQRR